MTSPLSCMTSSAESSGVPKMPRRDRHVADAVARQVALDRQRHAGDAALAKSVT
jgi:hypothetical protein